MALTQREQRRLLSLAKQGLGRKHKTRGMAERLGSYLGHYGSMLGVALDVLLDLNKYATGPQNRRQEPTDEDIVEAIQTLDRSGFSVTAGVDRVTRPPRFPGVPEVEPPPRVRRPGERRPPMEAPQTPRRVEQPRSVVQDPVQIQDGFRVPSSQPVAGTPPYDDLDTRLIMAPIVSGGSADVFSQMIRTPESSNVYAYGYDHDVGVLYVQYRAPGEPDYYKPQVSSCTGLEYDMGVREDLPGPIYAYGSRTSPILPSMFDQMNSARSKGEWIWQNLRICGTNYGHRYPYILTNPVQIGDSYYVPRKASHLGFRTRSVAVPGRGRRQVMKSTLPGYNDDQVSGAVTRAQDILRQRQARIRR